VLELWPDFVAQWIVHEDEDLIVVDKPAHVPSQAADEAHDDDLLSRLRRFLAARDGLAEGDVYLGVHQRLDRETSGLVLFTKRREANPAIARQFEQRTIEKTYVAVVSDVGAGYKPARSSTTLEHWLERAPGGRMRVVERGGPDARLAKTRLELVARVDDRVRVALGCDTGRTHQLRVQLAHVGAPIAGDRLYGGAPALRLLLHAERLALQHPTDRRALQLNAPAPIELERYLAHGEENAARDPQLFARALELALQRRYRLGRASAAVGEPTTAFRLLNAAGDGAPQLAIDVYGEHVVVHFFPSDGDPEEGGFVTRPYEEQILDAIAELGFTGIYVKRHPRQKNELAARDSRYAPAAPLRGQPAPDELVIFEHGVPFEVRLGDGLRTGLFLDQRDNRRRVREAARDRRVLNLFAYTGGFSVAALAGGAAEAICVDASATALAWAKRNVARIGQSARHRVLRDDAFDVLARLARRGERFGVIVLDPPSYASVRGRRFRVLRDYAELCAACVRVLAPGGKLLACINHHEATQAWLRKEVARVARAEGREPAQLRDLPAQLDFPSPVGGEPASKSVLLTSG
jgi:23S rRNA (cytosine1962-C5)-methyltransferase